MAATGDNTRTPATGASAFGDVDSLRVDAKSNLMEQFRASSQPRNLNLQISVPSPTDDKQAAELARAFSSITASSERRIGADGTLPKNGEITWGQLPPDLLKTVQARLGDNVTLNPNDGISKVLEGVVGQQLSKLGEQEGLKVVEALKAKLGPETTYALLGVAGAAAASFIAKENPGLVANFANQNIPNFKLVEVSADNFQGKVTLQPQLLSDLSGAYVKYHADFKASTADLNYGKKPPSEGEFVAVGGGTMKIQQVEGGALVALAKDGKEFPIPRTVPDDKDNTPLTSREQVATYLTTQLKSNLPFMSAAQQNGIDSANVFPPTPPKDGQSPVLTATGNVDGSTRGDIKYSGDIKVDRPIGPNSVGWNVGAGLSGDQNGISGYNVGGGATIPAGTVQIPLSASYKHDASGDTAKLAAGIDVPNWNFSVGAEMTMGVNGRTIGLPIRVNNVDLNGIGLGKDNSLTVTPLLDQNNRVGVSAGVEIRF